MDNSYYTGATLFRAPGGGGYGGNKYSHHQSPNFYQHQKHQFHNHNGSTTASLATSPLLMQSNILTGVPLIRNGQHIPPLPVSQPPPSPPSLICCFQPVYYFPTANNNTLSSSPTIFHSSTNVNMVPISNNRGHKQILKTNHHHHPQSHNNRRKNCYKLQSKSKVNNINNLVVTSDTQNNTSELQSKVPPYTSMHNDGKGEISRKYKGLPNPISPPPRQCNSVSTDSRSILSNKSSQQLLQDQQHFFTSSIESTKELLRTTEEKQRSENLLNFYFYEKHWRPNDYQDSSINGNVIDRMNDDDSSSIIDSTSSSPRSTNYSSSWESIGSGFTKNSSSSSPSPSTSSSSGEEIASNSSAVQQKDLEVEAQIITLANGHRDLEIRLCYVTS